MDVMVSVLMCVYNTPFEFLVAAVDSILNQTYKDIQFVIVDDASDNEEVIQYLNDLSEKSTEVLIIKNPDNLGLTKSLNIGMQSCAGKYIARMDSDDISLPERLSKQVEYMENHLNVALVGSEKINFGEGVEAVLDENEDENKLTSKAVKRKQLKNRCDNPNIYAIRSLLQHSGPAHPSFMFRKAFLVDNNIKYREDILKAQDYGIMADILMHGGKISKIGEPLIRYRMHNAQISATSEIEQKAYQSRVSFDYIKYLFPELSNDECAAVSMLGNDYEVGTLIDAVINNEKLYKTCYHIRENAKSLTKEETYVRALKRIVELNGQKHIYDEKMFESELRYEWWRKYLEVQKTRSRLWLPMPYTIASRKYAVAVRNEMRN